MISAIPHVVGVLPGIANQLQGVLTTRWSCNSLTTRLAFIRRFFCHQMTAKSCCIVCWKWTHSCSLCVQYHSERSHWQDACAWYPLELCKKKTVLLRIYLFLKMGYAGSVICSMIRNWYIIFRHRYKMCAGRGNLIRTEKEMIAHCFLEGII